MQGKTGHLFERRHLAIFVSDDVQLLGLVRYIHNNPVRAQLVAAPEDYAWSSHRAYVGEVMRDWLQTDRVLSLFSRRRLIAIRRYQAFMRETDSSDTRSDNSVDQQSSGLLTDLGHDTDEGWQPKATASIESIVHRHCARHALSEAQLTGPSRSRSLVRVRTDITIEALDRGIATIAELSRRLNRSEATLCEAVLRRRET